MPLFKVPKEYTFTSTSGEKATLSDLFAGQSQLIIYHLMFGPEWDGPCKSCSFFADSMPQHLGLLHERNTHLVFVSRAPADKLAAWQERMGWSHIPWYSSEGSTFNYDFHVTQDSAVAPIEYNYRSQAGLEEKGMRHHTTGEQPGASVFLKCPKGEMYHSYSAYGRGLDGFLTTYSLLELTPLGRQEPSSGTAVPPGGGKYHFEF